MCQINSRQKKAGSPKVCKSFAKKISKFKLVFHLPVGVCIVFSTFQIQLPGWTEQTDTWDAAYS